MILLCLDNNAKYRLNSYEDYLVILNSFEIAILRILVKRNQFPITIHGLIEGFPDGSENNVVSAISNLRDLTYVIIMPGDPKEEENIVYNAEKKNEILKIIDPLQEIKIENGSDGKHVKKIYKVSRNNKNQNSLLNPIKILISTVFIISFGMVTNFMPTTTDITHIIDDNIHHHYLKYGEAYGNNGDYYPKSIKGKVADLSFNGENKGDKATIDSLHHPACYRT